MFLDRSALNRTMGEDADYFCGYFSDSELTDLSEDYVGSVIDLEDLTKVSRQLDVSMGQMMGLVDVFAMVIFMVLIYLLSKIIIEKNAQSISMVKILGYADGEISRLYVLATSLIVVALLALSLPLERIIMAWLFRYFMMDKMTGWIPFRVDPAVYGKMFAMGVGTYAVVAALEYRRVRRVPMDEALKHVE
jgi:putative ABC transport system permease protein